VISFLRAIGVREIGYPVHNNIPMTEYEATRIYIAFGAEKLKKGIRSEDLSLMTLDFLDINAIYTSFEFCDKSGKIIWYTDENGIMTTVSKLTRGDKMKNTQPRVWEFSKHETKKLAEALSPRQIEIVSIFRKHAPDGPDEAYVWNLWRLFRERGSLTEHQLAALRNLRKLNEYNYEDSCPYCLQKAPHPPWARSVETIAAEWWCDPSKPRPSLVQEISAEPVIKIKELEHPTAKLLSGPDFEFTTGGYHGIDLAKFEATMEKKQEERGIRWAMLPRMLMGMIFLLPPVAAYLGLVGLPSRILKSLFYPKADTKPFPWEWWINEIFEEDISFTRKNSLVLTIFTTGFALTAFAGASVMALPTVASWVWGSLLLWF
jgi:hypothetical protein